MRLSWLSWFWPITILLLLASVSLVIFVPAISNTSIAVLIRPVITMTFLLICPGMALVPLFRLQEAVIELMIGIALSFAIDSFVAGILLYADHWSIVHILILLLAFSLVGAVLQLLILVFSPWMASHRASWAKKTRPQQHQQQVEAKEEGKSGKPVSTATPSTR